jgi:hypothetical protein
MNLVNIGFACFAISGVLGIFAYRTIMSDPSIKGAATPEGNKPKPKKTVLFPGPKQLEEEAKRSLEVYSRLWKKNEDHKNSLKELSKI